MVDVSEVSWVLVSSKTQANPQIILDSDNLPDYLSVFYDYGLIEIYVTGCSVFLWEKNVNFYVDSDECV